MAVVAGVDTARTTRSTTAPPTKPEPTRRGDARISSRRPSEARRSGSAVPFLPELGGGSSPTLGGGGEFSKIDDSGAPPPLGRDPRRESRGGGGASVAAGAAAGGTTTAAATTTTAAGAGIGPARPDNGGGAAGWGAMAVAAAPGGGWALGGGDRRAPDGGAALAAAAATPDGDDGGGGEATTAAASSSSSSGAFGGTGGRLKTADGGDGLTDAGPSSPVPSCASAASSGGKTSVTSADTADSTQPPPSPMMPPLATGGNLDAMETLQEEERSAEQQVADDAAAGAGPAPAPSDGRPAPKSAWGGGGAAWPGPASAPRRRQRAQADSAENGDGTGAEFHRRSRSWDERERGTHVAASGSIWGADATSTLSAAASPYLMTAQPAYGQERQDQPYSEQRHMSQAAGTTPVAKTPSRTDRTPPRMAHPYSQNREMYASPGQLSYQGTNSAGAGASPDDTSPLSSPSLSPHMAPQQPPAQAQAQAQAQLQVSLGPLGHRQAQYQQHHHHQQPFVQHHHEPQQQYRLQPQPLPNALGEYSGGTHHHQTQVQQQPPYLIGVRSGGGPHIQPRIASRYQQHHTPVQQRPQQHQQQQQQPQVGGGTFTPPHYGGPSVPRRHIGHSLSPMRGGYGAPAGPPASSSPQLRPRHDRHGGGGTGPPPVPHHPLQGGGQHGPHYPHHQQPQSQQQPPSARSAPEVLKTLLRKKACLYEPVTSRAVSLVAWIVGRDLALQRGYFSRQQLQSGVHDVVGDKIQDGVVTRTKVNRCLQVVLNSCFHYIIPRPDGSEESGEAFREEFGRTAERDDGPALRSLPEPWGDLAECVERTRAEMMAETAPTGAGDDGEGDGGGGGALSSAASAPGERGGAKRAVLLCFNENVRCAADVHRCHDEFVRDAARSANLHLGAEEWDAFFSGGAADPAMATTPTPTPGSSASVSPALSPGASVRSEESPASPPYSGAFGAAAPVSSPSWEEAAGGSPGGFDGGTGEGSAAAAGAPHPRDVLGRMSQADLAMFRCTWCAKRYDHDPALCSFAHVDVNGGWLRRDPGVYAYGDEMCPDVVVLGGRAGERDESDPLDGVAVNACPRGLECTMAHSWEEVEYHPDRYKRRTCGMMAPSPRSGGGGHAVPRCPLRDVCPDLHPRHWPSHLRGGAGARGGGHPAGRGRSARQERSPPRYGSRHVSAPGRRGGGHGAGAEGGASPGPGGGGRGAGGGGGGGRAADQTLGPAPAGPPMLYVGPAPESEFERSLLLPGLRCLFRRHSAALWAHRRGAAPRRAPPEGKAPALPYSCFGDGSVPPSYLGGGGWAEKE